MKMAGSELSDCCHRWSYKMNDHVYVTTLLEASQLTGRSLSMLKRAIDARSIPNHLSLEAPQSAIRLRRDELEAWNERAPRRRRKSSPRTLEETDERLQPLEMSTTAPIDQGGLPDNQQRFIVDPPATASGQSVVNTTNAATQPPTQSPAEQLERHNSTEQTSGKTAATSVSPKFQPEDANWQCISVNKLVLNHDGKWNFKKISQVQVNLKSGTELSESGLAVIDRSIMRLVEQGYGTPLRLAHAKKSSMGERFLSSSLIILTCIIAAASIIYFVLRYWILT
jgi:hypothetical protein